MIDLPKTISLPLNTEVDGTIRVSGTRVTLHSIIRLYQTGEPLEAIHDGFPTVPLADIYAIIAYYLAHQSELDRYLDAIDAEGEVQREAWESRYTPQQQQSIELFKKALGKKHEDQSR